MTVAELINELEQIEDKSVEVIMASDDYLPSRKYGFYPMRYGYGLFSKNL